MLSVWANESAVGSSPAPSSRTSRDTSASRQHLPQQPTTQESYNDYRAIVSRNLTGPPPMRRIQKTGSAKSVSNDSGYYSYSNHSFKTVLSNDSGYYSYFPVPIPKFESTKFTSAHFVKPLFSREPICHPTSPHHRDVNDLECRFIDEFQRHAFFCTYCKNPYHVYQSGQHLCERGARVAQEVVQLLYLDEEEDGIKSSIDSCPVDLPYRCDQVLGLLKASKHSNRSGGRPFVPLDECPHPSSPLEKLIKHDANNATTERLQKKKSPSKSGAPIGVPATPSREQLASRKMDVESQSPKELVQALGNEISTVRASQDAQPRDVNAKSQDTATRNGRGNESSNEKQPPFNEGRVRKLLSTAGDRVLNLSLRGLMDHVYAGATDALQNHGSTENESRQTRGRQSRDSLSSSQPSESSQQQKRVRGGDRDPGGGGDDSDDNDEDRPKKRNEKRGLGRLPSRRLKCPFYQREPDKFSGIASCRGEGFADMAKLKDHIKRVHTQPLRCLRCWEVMDSEDVYAMHLQQEAICDKKSEPLDDRIRHQTLKSLDFKKAPFARARSIEEKWKILFQTLFPKEKYIPSPYDQHGVDPRLEWVLYEAIEDELVRELEPTLEPILHRMKDRIPSIVSNCKNRLLRLSLDSDSLYTSSSNRSFISSPDSESRSQNTGTGLTSRTTSMCSGSAIVSGERLSTSDASNFPQPITGSSLETCVRNSGRRPSHLSPDSPVDSHMFDLDHAHCTKQGQSSRFTDIVDSHEHLSSFNISGSEKSTGTNTTRMRQSLPNNYRYNSTEPARRQQRRKMPPVEEGDFPHYEAILSDHPMSSDSYLPNTSLINASSPNTFQPLSEWDFAHDDYEFSRYLNG